ncbi:hypothetical protein AGMMS50293_17360 [Spirochaetia bacterium]|nr:hypothetical protein AGMMS50293_17360 [Spirochaetia bacterium]
MRKKIALCAFAPFLICLLPAFFSCVSAPAVQDGNLSGASSVAQSRAAADAAMADIDSDDPLERAAAVARSSVPTSPAPLNNSKAQPAWVTAQYSVFSESRYVAEVGSGASRDLAEKNALANLIAYFGQTIHTDQKITSTYQEAVKNGAAADWSEKTAIDNTITTSSALDSLVGAEIRDVWYDGKSVYYAVVVMDKAKTVPIYNDLIRANQSMIDNLTNMTSVEKNTIEGYSRYQFAGVVADINIAFGNLLSLIGSRPPADLPRGDMYRVAAEDIAKTIPIAVEVKNDRAGRIQGALAKSLSDLRFRSGGANSPYTLRVEIDLAEVQLANQQNKFIRYTITANLVDAKSGMVLLPYTISGREGHLTIAEAENRAITAAERKIGGEYKDKLQEYISRMLPKK